jgi:pimeloyl-ACP methyl ester carboxylesterase
MKPYYLSIQGLNIAVYQSREQGIPIVFIHGNSLSASTFTHQFSDKALNKFRLIAFDLPGHGNSSRSANPELDYSPKSFFTILSKLCKIMNVSNAILVGHSLGGHISINSLEFLPNAKALVTFGTTPLGVPARLDLAFLPNPMLELIFKPDLKPKEADEIASVFIAKGACVPNEIIKSISCTDSLVRFYVGKALTSGQSNDELKIILSKKIPFAVFHGVEDQLVDVNYFKQLPKKMLWKESVHFITNAGHSPQLENPKEFNSLLLEFIEYLDLHN